MVDVQYGQRLACSTIALQQYGHSFIATSFTRRKRFTCRMRIYTPNDTMMKLKMAFITFGPKRAV